MAGTGRLFRSDVDDDVDDDVDVDCFSETRTREKRGKKEGEVRGREKIAQERVEECRGEPELEYDRP